MGAAPAPLSAATSEAATQYVDPSAKSVSTQQWASALLVLLKAPVNDSNIANIQTWLSHEQDTSSWNSGAKGETALQIQSNPLGVGGAGNRPTSIFAGLLQTADALLSPANAQYGYPLIVSALRTNTSGGARQNIDPTQAFATAVTNSGWQSGSVTKGSYGKSATSFLASPRLNTGTATSGDQQGSGFSVTKGLDAVVGAAKDVAAPVTSVAGLIGDITNPTTLKNVGIFVAGLALAGVGLLIFFSQTKSAKTVEGAAAKAA